MIVKLYVFVFYLQKLGYFNFVKRRLLKGKFRSLKAIILYT